MCCQEVHICTCDVCNQVWTTWKVRQCKSHSICRTSDVIFHDHTSSTGGELNAAHVDLIKRHPHEDVHLTCQACKHETGCKKCRAKYHATLVEDEAWTMSDEPTRCEFLELYMLEQQILRLSMRDGNIDVLYREVGIDTKYMKNGRYYHEDPVHAMVVTKWCFESMYGGEWQFAKKPGMSQYGERNGTGNKGDPKILESNPEQPKPSGRTAGPWQSSETLSLKRYSEESSRQTRPSHLESGSGSQTHGSFAQNLASLKASYPRGTSQATSSKSEMFVPSTRPVTSILRPAPGLLVEDSLLEPDHDEEGQDVYNPQDALQRQANHSRMQTPPQYYNSLTARSQAADANSIWTIPEHLNKSLPSLPSE